MKELRRSPEWYLSWMFGDGAGDRRNQVADELVAALKSCHYDVQTLEEINLIFAHELLCVENFQQLLRQEGETGAAIENYPEPSLTPRWLEDFILTYSQSLSRSIHPSSHYERELQAHGIGLALSLLRANGVTVLEDAFKTDVGKQLKERFRTLQWLRQSNPAASGDGYRQFQTSWKLVFTGEQLKRFRNLTPIAVTYANKFFAAVSLACNVASFTIGAGLPSLRNTVDSLSQILAQPNPTVDTQYESLFAVCELTELTLALHRLGEALKEAKQRLTSAERIRSRAQQFALEILRDIHEAIGNHQMEANGPRRRSFVDYFNAFTNFGPSAFDRYYYAFGLLDCAARLSRILSLDSIPSPFKTRMVQIATRSVEPSFRWKAIEVLLSPPASRHWQYSTALGVQYPSETLRQELKVVLCDCLSEEENVVPPERTQSLNSTETFVSYLNPDDWAEDPPLACSLPQTRKDTKDQVAKIGRFERKFDSTGLSPDCQTAFFLRRNATTVLSLTSCGNAKQREPFKSPPNSEWICAALSNRFLVLSTQQSLMVYDYKTMSAVGKCVFETENEDPWIANCLAIHETQERAWIIVAGSEGMALNGSLRAYQIVIAPQSIRLQEHDAYFRSSVFDAEFIKHIRFCPRGTRLVCVTHTNKVLAFFLSNNARPRESPFRIMERYGTLETNAVGITSATIFHSWTPHPYVLCTTAPSSERSEYRNEWTYISAIGDGPNQKVPDSLRDNLHHLRRHEAILAGAVSPHGDLIALLEKSGRISITSLTASETQRRLRATGDLMFLKEKLRPQSPAVGVDPTCLRFHYDASGALWLKAVDVGGNLIALKVAEPNSQLGQIGDTRYMDYG